MDLGYYQVDKGSPQPCCHTFFFCFFEEEEAKAEVGLSITQVQVTDVVWRFGGRLFCSVWQLGTVPMGVDWGGGYYL